MLRTSAEGGIKLGKMPSLPKRIGRHFPELGKLAIRVDFRRQSREKTYNVFRRPKVVVVHLEKTAGLLSRIGRNVPKLKILVFHDDLIHESTDKTPIDKCNQIAVRWLVFWITMLIPITAYGMYLINLFGKHDETFTYVQKGKLIGDLTITDNSSGPQFDYKTDLHGETSYSLPISGYPKEQFPIRKTKVTYNKDDNMTVIKIGLSKIPK